MTHETARTRAREIARHAGRGPAAVSQMDYEQAKRELTGTSDYLRQEELLTPAQAASPVRRPGKAPRP